LSFRREILDLLFLHNYFIKKFSVPVDDFTEFISRRGDDLLSRIRRCRTESFFGSFFNRIIKTWNVLPIEIRAIHNHEHFKNSIVQFYKNNLMLRTHAVGLAPAGVPFVDHVFNGCTRRDQLQQA
jgi:hypothetical protein